jgi:hypothetical protein
MRNILTLILIISISSLNVNLYETEPYVELDWTKIEIGKIEIAFIDNISKSSFISIFLDNSTYQVQLMSNCAFGSNKVRCLITPNDISGDSDNKDYKFYYKLKYRNSDGNIESASVTVAINNGSYIKFYMTFFILLFIF